MDFYEALAQAYRRAPCQVLANPLWKTLAMLPACRTSFILDNSGTPDHLEIWRDTQLFLYWDTDRRRITLSSDQVDSISFALIHQDYLASLRPERFRQHKAYFRLALRPGPKHRLQPAQLPPGYSLRTVQIEREAQAVSDLIRSCYADISPSVETVRSWTTHPVYAPELWLWIWDETRGCPAGLGIAEVDPSAGECALEWIQVLQQYRGRGLGAALVHDLVRRAETAASTTLVTVSGEVQNESAPEQLYRRCGFTGQDMWWVLEK